MKARAFARIFSKFPAGRRRKGRVRPRQPAPGPRTQGGTLTAPGLARSGTRPRQVNDLPVATRPTGVRAGIRTQVEKLH